MPPSEIPTATLLHSPHAVRTARTTLDGDVVLAPGTRRMFDEAIGAMRHHKTIYSDWGFGSVDPTGRNMVINLYGPPGTGKTLAAEALAGTLGLPYLHLGIAELESKFVGETAKNISAAFNAAATEGALLFFDEADTLLGARLSSVTQGIDNEINAMRSTLLIELERFEGIVVFATNFAKNYDSASVASATTSNSSCRTSSNASACGRGYSCPASPWSTTAKPSSSVASQRQKVCLGARYAT